MSPTRSLSRSLLLAVLAALCVCAERTPERRAENAPAAAPAAPPPEASDAIVPPLRSSVESPAGASGPNAYVEMQTPVRARFVRYDHIHVGAANLAISDIRVFGHRWGSASSRPATPKGLTARRDRDARNAVITWQPVPGVVGYNVRWGIAPAKLYQTYQRFADQGTTLELRALTVGQDYWVAIESFDENGVSALSPAVFTTRF